MEIDIKTLKGEDLYYYLTSEYADKEISELVEMLPFAIPDKEKALQTLERVVQSGKTFVLVYPGLGEEPTDDMELIGPVLDGVLYIK